MMKRNVVFPIVTSICLGLTITWFGCFGGSGSPGPQPRLPQFPWPPPKPSASIKIPRSFLESQEEQISLGNIATRLERAFDHAGYVERSYYAVPNGFALVSRLEQFNKDGTPKDIQDRWSIDDVRSRVFSLRDYIVALFTANPGYYRVIVFVLTSVPFSHNGSVSVSAEEAREWLFSGVYELPQAIRNQTCSSDHYCTALIYEFERETPDHEATFNDRGILSGKEHLEKSNLWETLATSR